MRKFDILVPIILICCLIALAYILTQIFSEQEQLVQPRGDQSEIVLDPSRYIDEDVPPPANISNTPGALPTSEGSERASSRLDDYYNEEENYEKPEEEPATSQPAYETQPTATTDYVSESERLGNKQLGHSSSTTGRYLVIAGSFRQEIYAKDRVRNLKASGFKQTEMGYTNRGTYAVALVDALDTYSQAERLAQQVRAKGYEVFIKQRR